MVCLRAQACNIKMSAGIDWFVVNAAREVSHLRASVHHLDFGGSDGQSDELLGFHNPNWASSTRFIPLASCISGDSVVIFSAFIMSTWLKWSSLINTKHAWVLFGCQMKNATNAIAAQESSHFLYVVIIAVRVAMSFVTRAREQEKRSKATTAVSVEHATRTCGFDEAAKISPI